MKIFAITPISRPRLPLLFILLCITSPYSFAECTDSNGKELCYRGGSFYFDNDMVINDIVPKNDDRDYTMGLGFSFHGRRVTEWVVYSDLFSLTDWFEELFLSLPKATDDNTFHTASISNTAFSPDLIKNLDNISDSISTPVLDDRPFANLLAISAEKNQLLASNQASRSVFIFGVLGLDLGKAVQRQIHCDWGKGNPCPQGWNNQISDGGEPTFLYRNTRATNVDVGDMAKYFDLTVYREFEVGLYTDVAAGFTVRAGKRDSPFYGHAFNRLNDTSKMDLDTKMTKHLSDSDSYDLYGFITVGARAFAYNALLQGQFRENPHEFSSNELRPVVGEISAGFVFPFFWDTRLTYAAHYRSSEIRRGSGDREHWFAGLYLDWKFSTQN